MRTVAILGFIIITSLIGPVISMAVEIVFVANKSVPAVSLGKEEVKKIFLGKKFNWENGERVVFAVQDRTEASHVFLETFVRKNAYDYDLFWKKQVFTGKGQAPQVFSSDKDVIHFVAKTPGAIGYVSSTAETGCVKTIPVR